MTRPILSTGHGIECTHSLQVRHAVCQFIRGNGPQDNLDHTSHQDLQPSMENDWAVFKDQKTTCGTRGPCKLGQSAHAELNSARARSQSCRHRLPLKVALLMLQGCWAGLKRMRRPYHQTWLPTCQDLRQGTADMTKFADGAGNSSHSVNMPLMTCQNPCLYDGGYPGLPNIPNAHHALRQA